MPVLNNKQPPSELIKKRSQKERFLFDPVNRRFWSLAGAARRRDACKIFFRLSRSAQRAKHAE
jgi:hypothetical protein